MGAPVICKRIIPFDRPPRNLSAGFCVMAKAQPQEHKAMNTTHEKTDQEIADTLRDLSQGKVFVVCLIVDFFLIWEKVRSQARRFADWMAGKR